ncbi:integrase core domain-containing protein [Corynebacterium variabile]|uniref:integrase core domain-containing protein n=1 Tax=Corynebacterium variabile TaxID=1727 RepID=UPI003A90E8A5
MLQPPVELAQYVAVRYTERLCEAEAVASVGTVGDSYDNAMAESFNSLYKAELIHKQGPWTGLEQVEFVTVEYIEWCNACRLHGELGYRTPSKPSGTTTITTQRQTPRDDRYGSLYKSRSDSLGVVCLSSWSLSASAIPFGNQFPGPGHQPVIRSTSSRINDKSAARGPLRRGQHTP